jgi:tetratricopeptide (TPR) repeat protein
MDFHQARSYPQFEMRFLAQAVLAASFFLVCAGPLRAQRQMSPTPPDVVSSTLMPSTVIVNVREANGLLLDEHAFVKVSSAARKYSKTVATEDNSAATFIDVMRGDYDVEVSSAGYKTAVEHVNVGAGGSSYPIFIYLHSESEEAVSAKPSASLAMTPKLQGELDKGTVKLRKQQYDGARQHFEKAAKMAPSNANVQYLLGMLELSQKHFDLARAKFEGALVLYPAHERSLLALGELQLQTGDADGAVRTLEKAFAANGADWRMHFLLAQAYSGEKNYAKAEFHASRATELGKTKGALPLLLLARTYVADNKREAAKKVLELLIKEFPADPAAQQAKSELAALPDSPENSTSVAGGAGATPVEGTRRTDGLASAFAPATAPNPVIGLANELPLTIVDHTWAPADIDGKEYTLAPGVTCAQQEVIEQAQKHMLHQLQNFDKFMATERIEHQQVDSHGIEGDVRSKDFSYLVFVHPFKKDSFFLEESRDGGTGVDGFPTNLATTGLVGLGVAILEPEYQDDFEYKCEGLSSWRGQAAWQIRFEQKKGVESRVRVWRRRGELFPVALKGRIWLGANSYDLLHMESDLRDPVEKLMLVRDHLIIDYGPVTFDRGSEKLWLPWKAEMYMELHGRRYHHRHTLSNYMLFSVDTANQIGKPKQTPEPPEKEEKPQN